jgi:hypothetical protein
MIDRAISGFFICATFPRSGQRYLQAIISRYFQNDFVLFEPYQGFLRVGRESDFQPVPVSGPDNHWDFSGMVHPNWVKTHDFDFEGAAVLSECFPTDRHYIVQYRHPLESITSYYEFALNMDSAVKDSYSTWMSFFRRELANWERFMDLWALSDIQPRLLVGYRELVDFPVDVAARVIAFMAPGHNIDVERLKLCITAHNKKGIREIAVLPSSVKQSVRNIRDFRYFDPKMFRNAEKKVRKKYLKPLGIAPLLSENR